MELNISEVWKKVISVDLETGPMSCYQALQDEIFLEEDEEQITGIYLATKNLGAMEAVSFWKSALEIGPAFVFPKTFPSTLANFLAGHISRISKATGPNYTLVGDAMSVLACFDHAAQDLNCQVIQKAFVIAADYDAVQQQLIISGMSLMSNKLQEPTFENIELKNLCPSIAEYDLPSSYMQAIITRYESEGVVEIGHPLEGYVRLVGDKVLAV